MIEKLTALLDRLLSQEVARTNAALEAIRLQDSRRRLDEVHAFLVAHHDDPTRERDTTETAGTARAHDQRSRPEAP